MASDGFDTLARDTKNIRAIYPHNVPRYLRENFCLLSIHKSRCNKFLSVDGVKENLLKNICTLKILFTKQTVMELWKSNGSISRNNGGKYISSICDRIKDIDFCPSLHEIRPPPRKTWDCRSLVFVQETTILPPNSSSYLIAPLIDKHSPIKLGEEMTARFAWMHQPLLN